QGGCWRHSRQGGIRHDRSRRVGKRRKAATARWPAAGAEPDQTGLRWTNIPAQFTSTINVLGGLAMGKKSNASADAAKAVIRRKNEEVPTSGTRTDAKAAEALVGAHTVNVMITESESLRDRAHHAIAHRAHNLFEGRGREHGSDLDDWLQAESELSQPI